MAWAILKGLGAPALVSSATVDAATGRAAEEMGRADVGAIVPGRYADMVAVKADPLKDITVLEAIDHVMKGGAVVR